MIPPARLPGKETKVPSFAYVFPHVHPGLRRPVGFLE